MVASHFRFCASVLLRMLHFFFLASFVQSITWLLFLLSSSSLSVRTCLCVRACVCASSSYCRPLHEDLVVFFFSLVVSLLLPEPNKSTEMRPYLRQRERKRRNLEAGREDYTEVMSEPAHSSQTIQLLGCARSCRLHPGHSNRKRVRHLYKSMHTRIWCDLVQGRECGAATSVQLSALETNNNKKDQSSSSALDLVAPLSHEMLTKVKCARGKEKRV